jgi:hypothetical protein
VFGPTGVAIPGYRLHRQSGRGFGTMGHQEPIPATDLPRCIFSGTLG